MPVILFFLLWVACAARAEHIREPNFESLTKEAFALYPVKIEFVVPKIEFLSDEELRQWVCRSGCDLQIKGVYVDRIIYMNKNIEVWDDWSNSQFIHEVVHYLQDLSGKETSLGKESCDKRFTLELEAYTIQNQWLERRGKIMRPNLLVELATASAGKQCEPYLHNLRKKSLDTVGK